jgi:hypothetical protein
MQQMDNGQQRKKAKRLQRGPQELVFKWRPWKLVCSGHLNNVHDRKDHKPNGSEANEEVLLLLEAFVQHISPSKGQIAEHGSLRRLSAIEG